MRARRPAAPPPRGGEGAPTRPAPAPDASPSREATATPQPAVPPDDNSSPDSGPAPPAAAAVGNPPPLVARLYPAVSRHHLAPAAARLAPRMQGPHSPAVHIDHRFSAPHDLQPQ